MRGLQSLKKDLARQVRGLLDHVAATEGAAALADPELADNLWDNYLGGGLPDAAYDQVRRDYLQGFERARKAAAARAAKAPPKPRVDPLAQQLRAAIDGERFARMKQLIERGADVNTRDGYEQTALYVACRRNKLELVKWLLKRGADVRLGRLGSDTPLHNAGSVAVARLLVARGADVNAEDPEGTTPLGRAVDRPELVAYLLKQGARPGGDALWRAVNAGRRGLKGAALLIRAGAPLDARDDLGETPLHLAASNGDAAMVRLLLGAGADPRIKSRERKTPAQLAPAELAPLFAASAARR